jgi:4-amino-4-deoxy-L-arabinose transferase-like glycosyltransferase
MAEAGESPSQSSGDSTRKSDRVLSRILHGEEANMDKATQVLGFLALLACGITLSIAPNTKWSKAAMLGLPVISALLLLYFYFHH